MGWAQFTLMNSRNFLLSCLAHCPITSVSVSLSVSVSGITSEGSKAGTGSTSSWRDPKSSFMITRPEKVPQQLRGNGGWRSMGWAQLPESGREALRLVWGVGPFVGWLVCWFVLDCVAGLLRFSTFGTRAPP